METLLSIDWDNIVKGIDENGFCLISKALTQDQCAIIRDLSGDQELFERTMNVGAPNPHSDNYRYFGEIEPTIISHLRFGMYNALRPSANQLTASLHQHYQYPEHLEDFQVACAQKKKRTPSSFLAHRTEGNESTFHTGQYGETSFPYQCSILLNEEFTGGSLEIQTKREARSLDTGLYTAGDAVIFAGKYFNPTQPTEIQHRITDITQGTRKTLGILMHNRR